MLDKTRTERGWYNLLTEQTPESAEVKARVDSNYWAIRAWMHEFGGLKQCITVCAEYALQGGIPKGFFEHLNDIHPRALVLLAKHASEYRSITFDFDVEPEEGGCFGNAVVQTRVFNQGCRKKNLPERMLYVEGVAWAAGERAIPHAWVTTTDFVEGALDWTWYAFAGWGTYFGIPLTQRQQAILRKLAYPDGRWGLLFTKEGFPRIEPKLTEILKRRYLLQQRKLKKLLVVPDRDF